eukprot:TRINITY_DN5218_c2_g2_i1.p1 TRINITY_DN5218_c2_g2~~TRINITY_DN5218_c2_g2_i1.p1  ORF type:complete len:756 (+),score=96.25 TRINITY_DN5218_c2_g2_i1:73-2340(+)
MGIRPLHEYFSSEHDTHLDKRRKQVVVTTATAVAMFGIVGVIGFSHNGYTFLLLGTVMQVATSVLFLLKWLITKKLPEGEIAACLLLWLLAIIILDINEASQSVMRLWPCAVILLDVLLLCSLPQWVHVIILGTLSAFLCVDCVERHLRFGMYDIAGSTKLVFFRGCIDITEEEADRSPCPEPLFESILITSIYLGIVLIDFYCTSGFAKGMYKERQKLLSSISLAEKVVSDLIEFDLEEARISIDDAERTPLTEVLTRLLANLHQYRPYLPDSLFEISSESTCTSPLVAPVGPPRGESACILFTDMKSSTAIWEASPEAMKRALKIHNKLIRKCIEFHKGFEVKTIGDSFMVAFDTLREGVEFALDLQDKMQDTTWPSDLVLPPVFETQGWSGIMLRIGLHFGPVDIDVNVTSGRPDYFGRTVNKAARLEGACNPGGVAIDSSHLDRIGHHKWYIKRRYETLKGIDDKPLDIAILYRSEPVGDYVWSTSDSVSTIEDITPFKPVTARSRVEMGSLVVKSSATACKVQISINSSQFADQDASYMINTALGKAIGCLERAEGSIISVIATTITIGWNTARQCVAHFEGALRFTSLMYSIFASSDEISIGICSGTVRCGSIGTQGQRFVTVFGPCVSMSHLLCQASEDLGTFALCACVPNPFPLLRPVSSWSGVDLLGAVTVYEIRSDKLKQVLSDKIPEPSKAPLLTEWGWSNSYREAFEAGDWQTIDTKRDATDRVLQRVSQLMRTGGSLRTTFS